MQLIGQPLLWLMVLHTVYKTDIDIAIDIE